MDGWLASACIRSGGVRALLVESSVVENFKITLSLVIIPFRLERETLLYTNTATATAIDKSRQIQQTRTHYLVDPK
jgi:hypothetical protein